MHTVWAAEQMGSIRPNIAPAEVPANPAPPTTQPPSLHLPDGMLPGLAPAPAPPMIGELPSMVHSKPPSTIDVKSGSSDATGDSRNMANLVVLLANEQEKLCSALTDLMANQRNMWEAHAASQEQAISTFLEAHHETLASLRRISPDCLDDPSPDVIAAGDDPCTQRVNPMSPAPHSEVQYKSGASSAPTGTPERRMSLDAWRQCSGLHTVRNWVTNYNNHPSGWPALIMIHGIPETTRRLRIKVENYAIYSALLMSVSIEMVLNPPHGLTLDEQVSAAQAHEWWLFHLRKRFFAYGFGLGIACHMLSILIAMSFQNSLNEAARDSDVFRMFSRGWAFLATAKCEVAFRIGCVADFVAMTAGICTYIGFYEVLVGSSVLFCSVIAILTRTSGPLFRNGSITHYWRDGNPDEDDPFDIGIPMECFEAKARATGKDMGGLQKVLSEVSIKSRLTRRMSRFL